MEKEGNGTKETENEVGGLEAEGVEGRRIEMGLRRKGMGMKREV